MKDLYAFTNLCINQYSIEIVKEQVKGTNTATAITISLSNYANRLLGEIYSLVENKEDWITYKYLFNRSINEINMRGAMQ